jgi:hypothetical protein
MAQIGNIIVTLKCEKRPWFMAVAVPVVLLRRVGIISEKFAGSLILRLGMRVSVG